MQNLFQSHPYSTRVGTLIERVTDSGNLAIDWTIALEICDALGETDEGPREAIRAIRKRLTSSAGKDHISIWYTLILIEACLKNCGRRFQAQVANRDFLHDLIKVLLPKHNPPIQLQTKILFMIKSWVDASWDVPGRRDLEKVYTALRRKGVQFPNSLDCQSLPLPQQQSSVALGSDNRFKAHASLPRGEDGRHYHHHHQGQSSSSSHLQRVGTSDSPATTRARDGNRQIRVRSNTSGGGGVELGTQVLQVVAINGYPVVTRNGQEVFFAATPRTFMNHHQHQCNRYQRHHSPHQVQGSFNSHRSLPTQMYNLTADQTLIDQEGTVRRLSTAQRERLSQDLAVVQTNLHILNDMLTELQPDAISSDDLELLQELNETCRMMQQRVAEFLSQVADDAVTLTLIQLNDELNCAFQRYERFERYRLRAMRAQIANQNAGYNRPPLTAIAQSGSPSHPNQLQLQNGPSQTTQTNQLPAPVNQLSLPSTSTDHSSKLDNQQKDDDNQSVDDDDELLNAVAEQTQRNDSTSGELISVADWTDNALALQALRLNDTSNSTWNSDPNAAQLERVFGAGYHALTLNPTDNQPPQPALQSLPGPQLEPLQPQPAPPPAPKPASQPPVKKRTPSEVRRLEEALLLFDS